MKKILFPLLFLFPFLISACATWTAVGGKYTTSSHNFETELPHDWKKLDLTTDALLITKDGLLLQSIQIERKSIEKELPNTKKKLSEKMLPYEIAEVIADNMRANQDFTNYQIVENTPVTIGGYQGFKLVYTYQTKEGLRKKGVYYGVMLAKYYYKLGYEAPSRYYFEESYPDFEKVKESFHILKEKED